MDFSNTQKVITGQRRSIDTINYSIDSMAPMLQPGGLPDIN